MPVRVLEHPGTTSRGWTSDFLAQLAAQYARLGMPCPPTTTDLASAREHPELLVYFATNPWDATAASTFGDQLQRYADESLHLLPVVDRETDASTHLAPALMRFNAFIAARHAQVFAKALVDEALTLLWQRRRQRRIFISYRRNESQAMARQLHEHFSTRSFDVFLDERSIEPAVDFQHELRRRLDDSDAVLVLVTPGLADSRWVREELSFAQVRRIGLLGVVWPTNATTPTSSVVAQLDRDQQVVLTGGVGGLPDRVLDAGELAQVDRMMFEGRSQAIARRTTSLIDDASQSLAPAFIVVASRIDGDLDLVRHGQPWLGRIAPFRPSPYDLWRWWDEIRQRPQSPEGMIVLYPHVDQHDPAERAFRTICDAWGRSARPRVELQPVHL
ncbi:MAG: toll/interleukin-1 receptor domain-containing protein [Kofleriaceae bacterium]|jgi:hypothetical protein|nr:toll/interleukin-1 receptor domain-containing protein [Kofleriaceae bacterium]MBP9169532.1 toll/interleukin-1 receptor domain-containing protein [Kofleriaceae bacterium]MBP9859177.1 toll/interleukin-1 receptor domain-containing protein [Kofleriaceae bacterium]